jgi:hypothetical protein
VVSRALGLVILLVGLLLFTVLKRTFNELFLAGLTAFGAVVAVAAIVVGVLLVLPRRVSRSSDTFA